MSNYQIHINSNPSVTGTKILPFARGVYPPLAAPKATRGWRGL